VPLLSSSVELSFLTVACRSSSPHEVERNTDHPGDRNCKDPIHETGYGEERVKISLV